jgi:hypothetical protein
LADSRDPDEDARQIIEGNRLLMRLDHRKYLQSHKAGDP